MTNKNYLHDDIQDSPEDQEKLKPEEATLDLPELKDIPGAGRLEKNASLLPGDTTISTADEEGEGVLDESDDDLDDEIMANGSDVTPAEKKLLRDSFDPSYDTDLPVESISLDQKDDDGVSLNESGIGQDLFGEDLDDSLVKEEDEESVGEDPENQD